MPTLSGQRFCGLAVARGFGQNSSLIRTLQPVGHRQIMSANRLSHLFESSSLDWSKLIISPDTGTKPKFDFPLSPGDFLKFAKADLEAGGARGYINSLSNAKRAMDCRVESIIAAVGYSASGLRMQLGKENVSIIEKGALDTALPFTYKFFESLGGFTPSLLDRVRRLRHDVEHRFQKPSKRKASEALEIAELFVRSTEGLVSDVWDSYSFGSGQPKTARYSDELQYEFHVTFKFAGEQSIANVVYWDRDKNEYGDNPNTDVLPRHSSYYWLVCLSVALSRDLDAQSIIRRLVSSSGAKIQTRGIKVICVH